MAMAPATRALVARALRQREAARRAEVAAADLAQARRAAEELGLEQAIARERDAVPADGAGAFAAAMGAAWHEAAGNRLALARGRTREADAACDTARTALAGAARLARAFDLLMARQDAERRLQAERRDPLPQLMVVAHRPPAAHGHAAIPALDDIAAQEARWHK